MSLLLRLVTLGLLVGTRLSSGSRAKGARLFYHLWSFCRRYFQLSSVDIMTIRKPTILFNRLMLSSKIIAGRIGWNKCKVMCTLLRRVLRSVKWFKMDFGLVFKFIVIVILELKFSLNNTMGYGH